MIVKQFGNHVCEYSNNSIQHFGIHEQARIKFSNGYEASIIRTPYSYGGKKGLWELAVLNKEGELEYSTPITDDVLGHLTDNDVAVVLDQIAALPTH